MRGVGVRRWRPSIRWRVIGLLLALAVAGCGAPALTLPTDDGAGVTTPAPMEPDVRVPTGSVRVAYPEMPLTWAPAADGDLAAADLQALWGLPLFRYDEAGQLRPGLAEDFSVESADDGWHVVLDLRNGVWSDGTPVNAEDVVGTLTAAQGRDAARFAALTGVGVADDGRVRLSFAGPYARWADLLHEAGPVLPAPALADGLDAYTDGVPVSGGWYRVTEVEPGRLIRFSAHPDGPLGAPGLAEIEIHVTPRYETALGLLARGDVDLVVGYTALNAAGRATALEGIQAAVPLGGTWAALLFRPGGGLGGADEAAARRGISGAIDLSEFVEGLLGPAGAPATSPWPGHEAPSGRATGDAPAGRSFVLVVPDQNEVLGFTARAIQRDLQTREVTAELVSEPSPRFVTAMATERDVALHLRRDPPVPALTPWAADIDPDLVRQGEAAGRAGPGGAAAVDAVVASARIVPLYRVGVLHAWTGVVTGLRPSAWPGAGFWNVGEWRARGDEAS
jgi:hypothetical protein